jgi:hypothetical protein
MLFGRRVTFTLIVLASQFLLMASAAAWVVQLFLIAQNSQVFITETNQPLLYLEIAVTLLITLFAIFVFILQLKRLGERRQEDNN